MKTVSKGARCSITGMTFRAISKTAGIIERFGVRGIAAFITTASIAFAANAQTYIARVTTDVDGDGYRERIDLDGGRDSTLKIWHGKNLLWQGVPKAWRPWKLAVADIDGDGMPEIIVGVTKSTKFFPKPHNCLFIYGWNGKRAFPKWLGSSLGRPFTDFMFVDLDEHAGAELIAIETTLDGNKVLSLYRWNSFGFTLERQSSKWRSVRVLDAKNGRISLEADGEFIFLSNDLTRSR